MVDIHNHMLPGTDDGSRSWEVSKEMCAIAVKDGIRHIVCTPHANERFVYDRQKHAQTLARLQEMAGDSLTFSLGCDFHFSYENVQKALKDPSDFLIGASKYMLVEFSDFAISSSLGDTLLRLKAMGIVPIVTHPERNMMMRMQPEHVIQFVENGCAIQITANSLTGHWGEGPKKTALWLLERQAVHVIASDAHDAQHRRPALSEARDLVATMFDEGLAQALVQDNPHAVVSNATLPYFPPPGLR